MHVKLESFQERFPERRESVYAMVVTRTLPNSGRRALNLIESSCVE